MQSEISRALVAFSAIGKSLAFFTFIFLWFASLGSANAAFASLGDAFLAGVFAVWLAQSRTAALE